jgi:opacity protein-like surface antigen
LGPVGKTGNFFTSKSGEIMIRKIALMLLCSFLLFSLSAAAQDKAEVFGGYQYLHANSGSSGVPNFNLNGWDAAVSGYVNHYFGITADFSGTYGTPSVQGVGVSTHLYTYLFGPVVRADAGKLQPFAHALFGGAHISGSVNAGGGVSASASDSGFAYALGGGVDYKALPHISIRLGQFDFLQTRISGDSQNNFRYSGGVVIRF